MKKSPQKKAAGEGMAYTNIRRITGYLAGAIDHINDAKYIDNANKSSNSMSAKQQF